MAFGWQRRAFGRQISNRLQRVAVIAFGAFNCYRAFNSGLHLFFVALDATGHERLLLFRLPVFQIKIGSRDGRLAGGVAGEAILDGSAHVFVVSFMTERKRRFFDGRVFRIQFGVDDLTREKEGRRL